MTAWLREGRPPTEAERAAVLRPAAVLHPRLRVGLGRRGRALHAHQPPGVDALRPAHRHDDRHGRPDVLRRDATSSSSACCSPSPPRRSWAGPGRRRGRRGSGVIPRLVLAWVCATGVPLAGLIMLGAQVAERPGPDVARQGWRAASSPSPASAWPPGCWRPGSSRARSPTRSTGVRRALGRIEQGDLDARVTVTTAPRSGCSRRVQRDGRRAAPSASACATSSAATSARTSPARALDGDGPRLGGEVRDVAVLFVDLIGSTSLAARGRPPRGVALLNDFFAVVVDVVERHGGWVNKFEGDAALVVFGAPADHPDPAARRWPRRASCAGGCTSCPQRRRGHRRVGGRGRRGQRRRRARASSTPSSATPSTRRPGSASWPSAATSACWPPSPSSTAPATARPGAGSAATSSSSAAAAFRRASPGRRTRWPTCLLPPPSDAPPVALDARPRQRRGCRHALLLCRLRDRGRRLGRLRAGQPPVGGPRRRASCCSRPAAAACTRTSRSRRRSPSSSTPSSTGTTPPSPSPTATAARCTCPRGKGLGGSSAMNAMLYVRGRPLDYDLWERRRAAGPGTDVRPYFLRAEDNARGASEHHAVGGPLRVADERSPRPLTGALPARRPRRRASRVIADYNGPEQDGAALVQVTQHNGRRWSTADAYLRPACGRATTSRSSPARPCSASSSRAAAPPACTGATAAGASTSVRAEREVILSRGRLRLAAAADAVGHRPGRPPARARHRGRRRRARRRRRTSRTTRSSRSSARRRERVARRRRASPRYLLEWLLRRSGPLTSTVAEAFAFVRSRPGLPAPDLQFHFAPAYFVDHGAAEFDGHALTLGPVLVAPRSRGELRLRSADPRRQAADRHQLAGRARGRRGARWPGCELAREIVAHGAAARPSSARDLPGADVQATPTSRPTCAGASSCSTTRSGTCRMGTDDDGRRRSRAARARRRGPARRRRLDHAADPRRQHERADDHDRRARRGPHPRRRAAADVSAPAQPAPA